MNVLKKILPMRVLEWLYGPKRLCPFHIGQRIYCIRDGALERHLKGEVYLVRGCYVGTDRWTWFVRITNVNGEYIPGSSCTDNYVCEAQAIEFEPFQNNL